jgi:hypothetical protein
MSDNEISDKEKFEEFMERGKQLVSNSKSLIASMDELQEWNSVKEIMDNFSAIQKFAQNVVLVVEITSYEIEHTLKSEDKLKAASKVIDEYLKLPWYMEFFDGMVIHSLLKGAVYFINKAFGKDWDLQVARDALQSGQDFFDAMKEKLANEK